MKLVLRGHPQDRMRERNISVDDIEYVIRNAQQTVTSDVKNSVRYTAELPDGRKISVVTLPPGWNHPEASVVVKTVW